MPLRRTKDITVYQFPTRLLLSFFQRLHFVVSRNVFTKSTNHDCSNGSRKKQDDHERIDNGKVVNVIVGAANEIHIPTIRPWKIRSNPFDFIRVQNFERITSRSSAECQVGRRVIDHRRGTISIASGHLGPGGDFTFNLMFNRDGVNIKSSNTNTIKLRRIFKVGNSKLEMVVQVVLIILESGITWRSLKSDRIPTNSIIQFLASHENRKLIKRKLHTILSFHKLAHPP
mmetsp:Transcript_21034/g.38194  ORF Transcript_21034/g.38194 Transcript_21034/m.38194 type:complete len:229 (+) Transcript_21034:1053-1739(+)